MKDWPKLRLAEADVQSHFREQGNVGLLLGEPSGGLVDVDLDAVEARVIGWAFLPRTERVHGRNSRLHSHAWYVASRIPKPEKFTDVDGTCLVELRSSGQQTLVPPSTHPSGERIVWESEGEPSAVNGQALRVAVARVAAACLLARHWPAPGNRHEAALALAGMLLRTGWNEDDSVAFVSRVAQAAADEEWKARAADVRSTARRLSAEGAATGSTRLRQLVGTEVVDRVCRWLSLRQARRISVVESPSWPEPPAREAFYGLVGDIVGAIEPHSEADPVALLAQALVAFGNIIGRGPHFLAESDVHDTNLFAVMVGATSKGRKGSSWAQIRNVFEPGDPLWAGERVQSGLSSGEGLIWAVRDQVEERCPIKEKGRVVDYQFVVVDPGVDDKRLLAVETEFCGPLRLMSRESNILSTVLRQAWDSGRLRTITKTSPTKATGAHISVIGHTTKEELLRYLDSTEAAAGFANRFLWFCVRRSKVLPDGGRLAAVDFRSIVHRLQDAVEFARTVGEVRRDEGAREVWHRVYANLSEGKPGLFGAVIARAEAQVMRLAMLYALLDQSGAIRREHLLAGLALWEYAETSARFIFGEALGDVLADELLKVLRGTPGGLTRTQVSAVFGRHRASRELDRAFGVLHAAGLARRTIEETGGRPSERWVAVLPTCEISGR